MVIGNYFQISRWNPSSDINRERGLLHDQGVRLRGGQGQVRGPGPVGDGLSQLAGHGRPQGERLLQGIQVPDPAADGGRQLAGSNSK